MTNLMKGKRGLIMGVANEKSIAWGIAREMAEQGAELAFTYQGESFGKRVKPLAASLGSDILVDADVTNDESLDLAFSELKSKWGKLDFIVHAVAYSDKKLKKNIKTLDGSKVYKMRGVSFDRIDTNKSSSGVIAQEIQEVLPELVTPSNDEEQTLHVSYDKLNPILIKTLQNQKKTIKLIEKRIKKLEIR